MKKNRLPFSAIMIEEKKTTKPDIGRLDSRRGISKKLIKNSTYQYSKKNYRQSRSNNRSFSGKSDYKNTNENKIPPLSAIVVDLELVEIH